MNVSVTIVTGEHKDVLTVPREAIRQDDSKPYVYQIVDDKLLRRDVQTSLSNLTKVEVTGGLKAGDLLALTPTNPISKPLQDGLPVKVVR